MADPFLTLQLGAETFARLEAAAAAAGQPVESYVRKILETVLEPPGMQEGAASFEGAHDWTEADRRLAEYDRTGEYVTLDDWLAELRADVKSRRTG